MRMTILIAVGAVCAFADSPRFEVASVKLTANIRSGFGKEQIVVRPGNVIMRNVRLRAVIKWAYDVKEYQIAAPSWMGAPGWMGSEIARFEIAARAPVETATPDLKRMMQTLLGERFKLELHHESKEVQAYTMTLSKRGSSLREIDGPPEEGVNAEPNGMVLRLRGMTIAQFAEWLSGPIRAPVIDKTNLPGYFDLTVDMSAYNTYARDDEPFLFVRAIQDQLGLKLEHGKALIQMLVVDRADKMPSEN